MNLCAANLFVYYNNKGFNMSNFQIKMPKLGESITEGTIISWLVKVGDNIKEDDILFEVTTAKVNAEVPSPIDGKLVKIYFQEGETVPVGLVVADILIDGGDGEQSTIEQDQATQEPNLVSNVSNQVPIEQNNDSIESNNTPQGQDKSNQNSLEKENSSLDSKQASIKTEEIKAQSIENTLPGSDSADQKSSRWYSPVVMQMAKDSNISAEELDNITGTGYLERLSKKDISNYIELKKKGLVNDKRLIPVSPSLPFAGSQPSSATNISVNTGSQPSSTTNTGSQSTPSFNSDENTETRDMDIVGRIIADRMVQSKRISAHVTTVVEADVTKLVMWRNKQKDSFKEREGISLTFLPAIVEATTKALKEFPQINASVDGYKVILKKRINLGIAVSLDNGNLIVPVIHDADKLSISGIAHAIDDQAKKARNNKLKPSDIEGGTFTITNFGSFRNIIGTPIINQPEVAILGIGFIEKKPAVIETPEGDVIAIRHKMYLSLSYDHRLINGSLGGAFVRRIADLLEDWDI